MNNIRYEADTYNPSLNLDMFAIQEAANSCILGCRSFNRFSKNSNGVVFISYLEFGISLGNVDRGLNIS